MAWEIYSKLSQNFLKPVQSLSLPSFLLTKTTGELQGLVEYLTTTAFRNLLICSANHMICVRGILYGFDAIGLLLPVQYVFVLGFLDILSHDLRLQMHQQCLQVINLLNAFFMFSSRGESISNYMGGWIGFVLFLFQSIL